MKHLVARSPLAILWVWTESWKCSVAFALLLSLVASLLVAFSIVVKFITVVFTEGCLLMAGSPRDAWLGFSFWEEKEAAGRHVMEFLCSKYNRLFEGEMADMESPVLWDG